MKKRDREKAKRKEEKREKEKRKERRKKGNEEGNRNQHFDVLYVFKNCFQEQFSKKVTKPLHASFLGNDGIML